MCYLFGDVTASLSLINVCPQGDAHNLPTSLPAACFLVLTAPTIVFNISMKRQFFALE